MECDFFSFFLFFLFFVSWPLFFCFLNCAPIVHPQCTRFGNLSIINNILTLFIKKKKDSHLIDWGLILSLMLCRSSPILFQNRVSLICHCKGVLLPGQILEKLLWRLGWTNSCFLQIGWTGSQQFLKDGCLGCAQIIFQLFLRVDFFRGSMPFRCENMWLKEEGFVDRVQSWWDSY